jgi:hypothetical protein
MNAVQTRVAIYMVLIGIGGAGLVRGEQAVRLAREVDHKQDIRACKVENEIRKAQNIKNDELEATARLTVQMFKVLRQDGHTPETNAKMRTLARAAAKVKVEFKPAKLTNCEREVPSP